MDISRALGGRLREMRKRRGLSQEKLAELAGVNAKYYSEVERGKRNVTLKNLAKIASNLGITLEDIFRFPFHDKLSPEAEEVVALVIDLLEKEDHNAFRRLKLFLTQIL